MTQLERYGWQKLRERTQRLLVLIDGRAPLTVVKIELGLIERAIAAATRPEELTVGTETSLRHLEALLQGLCAECGDALATKERCCDECWLRITEGGEA